MNIFVNFIGSICVTCKRLNSGMLLTKVNVVARNPTEFHSVVLECALNNQCTISLAPYSKNLKPRQVVVRRGLKKKGDLFVSIVRKRRQNACLFQAVRNNARRYIVSNSINVLCSQKQIDIVQVVVITAWIKSTARITGGA